MDLVEIRRGRCVVASCCYIGRISTFGLTTYRVMGGIRLINMRKISTAVTLQVVGVLAISVGAALIYLAAGFIVAGVGLVAFGVAGERND